MAPHSSTLAWKIPWTEEPGGLQPMGWQRVGHNLDAPGDAVAVQEAPCSKPGKQDPGEQETKAVVVRR